MKHIEKLKDYKDIEIFEREIDNILIIYVEEMKENEKLKAENKYFNDMLQKYIQYVSSNKMNDHDFNE